MNFSRWPLLAATVFLLAIVPHAAFAQDGLCKAVKQTQRDGAVITIRPAGKNRPADSGCEVYVHDRNGKTVFERETFDAEIHPATGKDLDHDDRPDIVIRTAAGNNPGSRGLVVISFARARTSVLQTGQGDLDLETKPGRTLLWTTAAFPELGTDPDDPPMARMPRELGERGLVDVTQEYCKPMLSGELRGPGDLRPLLNALPPRSKQASRTDTGSSFDREQTRLAALSLALQQIYCGQNGDASQLVLEVWPTAEQARIRKLVKDAVKGRWPDLANKMTGW
jgi:hypothetical protein